MNTSATGLLKAAHFLRHSGIVAYATESCFGLGCDPLDYRAVMRLLRLKQRSVRKGLILVAASTKQLGDYVQFFPQKALQTWPGPYTWLLPTTRKTPVWIRGRHDKVAVRVSAHAQVHALCHVFGGALVSTSANISNDNAARTYQETQRRFGNEIDFVLPGRIGRHRRPSQIIDGVSGQIIRPA